MSWTAAAGAAVGIGGAAAGIFTSKAARKHATKESKKNRAFQERMARKSYRYGMQDMRKAGLNPMLAYQKGGAATPSGSQALIPNVAQDTAKHISNAIQGGLAIAQSDKLKQDTITSAKQASKIIDDAALTRQLEVESVAKTANSAASAEKQIAEARLIGPKSRTLESFERTLLVPMLKRVEDFINTGKQNWEREAEARSSKQYIITPKNRRK